MTLNVNNMLNPFISTHKICYDGFTIETIVTNETSIVEQWISSRYAKKERVVGLDTEWMRIEKASKKIANIKFAILQLCMEDKCLIVQLFCMNNVPPSLQTFMMDSTFEFVGVGVMNDLSMLKKNYGLEYNKHTYVFVLAKKRWLDRISAGSLKYLAKELVDLDMDKSKDVCTSDWKVKKLTKHKLNMHAFVHMFLKIGKMVL